MRYCPRCGAQLPADARFCTQCGAPVDAPAPASSAPPAHPEPLETPTVIAPSEPKQPAEPPIPPANVASHETTDDATQVAPAAQTYNPFTDAAPRGSLSEQFAANSGPQPPHPPQGLGGQFAQNQPPYPQSGPNMGPGQPGIGAQFQTAPPFPSHPAPPQAPGQNMGGQQPGIGSQFQSAAGSPQNMGGPRPGIGAQFAGASPFPQNGPQTTQALPWGEQQNVAPNVNFAAFDWRTNLPGLIRLGGAFLLVFTTIFVWWRFPASSWGLSLEAGSSSPTYDNVFALIGCLSLMVAIVAQIVLHPSLFGKSLPSQARLGIRAGLVLPALFAVILEVATFGDSNTPGAGVIMLSLAGGLVLRGLDDSHDAIAPKVSRIVGIVLCVLSVLASVLFALGCLIELGKNQHISAIALPNAFLALGLGVLCLMAYIKNSPMLLRLSTALAVALVVSYLFGTWAEADYELAFKALCYDPLPIIPLVWALALARADRSESEAETVAWTGWVPIAFFIAGAAAIVQLIDSVVWHMVFNNIINNSFVAEASGSGVGLSSGAIAWTSILMFLLAVGYIAIGLLLQRSPLTRLLAIGVTSFAILAVLITAAASDVYITFGTAMLGYILWLPLLGVLALTLPKSVREASGSLIPTASTPKPDPMTMPY